MRTHPLGAIENAEKWAPPISARAPKATGIVDNWQFAQGKEQEFAAAPNRADGAEAAANPN
jgi:hypothetical protein